MRSTPSQAQSKQAFDPSGRDVLRFFCIAAVFYSVGAAAHGVLMATQFLSEDIPSGVVQSVGHVKAGYRLTFDDGRKATFGYAVAYEQPTPIELKVGDRVAKSPGTIVYLVNDRAVTDWGWLIHTWLLPTWKLVLFASYLLLGGWYVLLYRRTPVADQFRRHGRDRPPATVRRVSAAFLALFASWLLLVGGVFLVFGFVTFGIGGVIRQIMSMRSP